MERVTGLRSYQVVAGCHAMCMVPENLDGIVNEEFSMASGAKYGEEGPGGYEDHQCWDKRETWYSPVPSCALPSEAVREEGGRERGREGVSE
jgi:hypothetical protein